MSLDSTTPRVPKRRLDCDVHSLPLSPEEAFLLSRIDDRANEAELALLTGLDVNLVRLALQRLADLGAIRIETITHRPPPKEIDAVVSSAFASNPPPSVGPTDPPPATRPASRYPVYELEELCDLGLDEKREILDLYYRLDELDHYALLRVPRNADKRTIKRAYYALAPNFHPDRYFRKDLGSFKSKMEAIFGRLTLAHDTLTRTEERATYDSYLANANPPPPVREAPIRADSGRWSVPSSQPTPAQRPSSIPPSSPEEERLRRAALARKLGLASAAPPATSTSTSSMSSVSSMRAASPSSGSSSTLRAAELALESLRHRHREKKEGSSRHMLRHYLDAAQTARAAGDLVTAANCYRIARELAPDDMEIAAAQEQTAKEAAAALALKHLQQGDFEANQERWADAVHSYTKAANGLPKHTEAQIKLARTLLKAGGDVRKAVEYARRAVALEPRLFDARFVLAEAYIAAGLHSLAKKELQAMREIDPNNARLTSLAKRIK